MKPGFYLLTFDTLWQNTRNHLFFRPKPNKCFFVDDDQNPQWKVLMHKEARSIHLEMDSIIESNNIDDDAPWLNTTLLTPVTHEGAHLVGVKELLVKESTFVNELV
jgi:hypothetical protein